MRPRGLFLSHLSHPKLYSSGHSDPRQPSICPLPPNGRSVSGRGVLSRSNIPPSQGQCWAPAAFGFHRWNRARWWATSFRVCARPGGGTVTWLWKWTCSTSGRVSSVQLLAGNACEWGWGRWGRALCCLYHIVSVMGMPLAIQKQRSNTMDCTHARKYTHFTSPSGTQLTVVCCIITSGGRFPSCRHFFRCDYCPAGYS